MDKPEPITHVTREPAHNRAQAIGALFESIYTDLQHVASGLMQHERTGHTLGTSGVLHEAFQRLIRTYTGTPNGKDMNQDELRAITAQIMRRVLVDHARSREARRRAHNTHRDLVFRGIDEITPLVGDLLALEQFLAELALIDKTKASVVELRFFGGMPMPKIAALLDRSLRSVERDWAFARAWLGMKLQGEHADVD